MHIDEIKNIVDLNNNMKSGSYKYVYLIGKYIINNISHDEILKLIKNEDYCKEKSEELLKQTKVYAQKTFSKNKKQWFFHCFYF